jgi:quercetin dioxygenase-like cupin family protein
LVSIADAGSSAPGALLIARAAQGLGGALVFPATLSLVNTTFATSKPAASRPVPAPFWAACRRPEVRCGRWSASTCSYLSRLESRDMDFFFQALPTVAESVPWVPLGEGESFKPLRFLGGNRGRVLLLRLAPGSTVPSHRHTGDVHAFNLEGSRELIDNGQVVGPGDYVYEPAGNADSWRVVGDVPCTVFIATRGAMEYLDENGVVLRRDTTDTMREAYLGYCQKQGIEVVDLDG